MAHSRRTFPPIPIAVLVLTAAVGHLAAVVGDSALSDAGNWASIAAAVFAFLILMAGGARWVRHVVTERRAARAPRTDYGMLDYEPEFTKASEAYSHAMEEIAQAMGRSTAVWVKNQELTTQAQADETAAASHDMCEAYERLLPVMVENGRVMRVCLHGLIGTWHLASEEDSAAVRQLREVMTGSRRSTAEYLRALRGNRRSTAVLRRRNWSASLNESAKRQQTLLKVARRTVRRTLWGQWLAEWRLGWLLLLFRVLGPLRRLRET